VLRPAAVVREMPRLGSAAARRVAGHALSLTGLSWAGARVLDAAAAARARGVVRLRAEPIEDWPDWTTTLWESARATYGFTAARTGRRPRALVSRPHARAPLRFFDGTAPVGWGVLLDTRMLGSAHFGNLRVGTLVDCMCRPGAEGAVAGAALRVLGERGVELALANATNVRWREALRLFGFREAGSNYVLATSRALTQAAPELARDPGRAHVVRGDGDGRINL
jgi:hypothetical protein